MAMKALVFVCGDNRYGDSRAGDFREEGGGNVLAHIRPIWTAAAED